MVKIGLREANQHFSKYVKMIRYGKEVVLTDRGKPLAVIKPIHHKEITEEERIKQLEDQGILKRTKKTKMPLHKLVTLEGKPLSEIIAEERGERL
jgi:prevent-host-death family protein